MDNRFFEQPILNSPYEYPARHWELDDEGRPTQQILESRRRAKYIVPIPEPRKRKDYEKQPHRIDAPITRWGERGSKCKTKTWNYS